MGRAHGPRRRLEAGYSPEGFASPAQPQRGGWSSREGGLPPPRGAGPLVRSACAPSLWRTQRPSRTWSEMSWDADGGSGAEVAALSDKGSPGEDGFVPSALGTREQ